MLKQLWAELTGWISQTAEKWGLGPRWNEARMTGRDLATQYRATSPRTKSLIRWVFILAAILLLVTFVFKAWTTPKLARLLFLPVPVGGYHVQVKKITDIVGASGVVQVHATVYITSRVDAVTVKEVPVKIGDIVTKGAPMLSLEQSIYGPALAAAQQSEVATKAAMFKADGMLQAAQELKKAGLDAEVDVQDAIAADATAKQAEAQAQKTLAEAQLDFDFTQFQSPLNGIVIASNVNPGDTVSLKAPVFTLGVLDTVYFVALVQENELPFISTNAPVDVIFSSLPTQTFHGFIEKIDPTIDPSTRTFNAYVTLDNPKLIMKPGITGFGRITIERTALAIPETAVMNQYGATANVFVVNQDGRAVLTPVILGLYGQNCYEVISGLNEGDVVVSVGSIYLKNNERVHVTFRDRQP